MSCENRYSVPPGSTLPPDCIRLGDVSDVPAQPAVVRLVTLGGTSYLASVSGLVRHLQVITQDGMRRFQLTAGRDDSGRWVYEELHPDMPNTIPDEEARDRRATH